MKEAIKILENNAEAVVICGGVKVEFNACGNVVVYTNGDVKVRPAVNDDNSTKLCATREIGNQMPDGTIFAGISPDTGGAMYTTPADAPLPMKWREAMDYAAGLDAHGHKDWRLPSTNELNVLFNKRAAIGGFQDCWYWSSSEDSSSLAWFQRFSDGDQYSGNKTSSLLVRCIRG